MAANIGNPEIWSQFGLAGLVIFALFGLVVFFIYRLDQIDKRGVEAIKEQSSEHRTERREWREGSNRQLDRFENALNNIAVGLRNKE